MGPHTATCGSVARLRSLARQLRAQQPPGVTSSPPPHPAAAAEPSAKRVWFVRHGESQTNVSGDWTHRDPDLTANGRAQAERVPLDPILADALAPPDSGSRAELVVVSPLLRTLRTAMVALGEQQPPLPMVANPDIQETFPLPCDTGRPTSVIAPLFPRVDMSTLPQNWYELGKTDAEGESTLPLLEGFELGDPITDEVTEIVRGGTEMRCRLFTQWMVRSPTLLPRSSRGFSEW